MAASALTGGSLYTYLAARFIPLIFAGLGVYCAVCWALSWRRSGGCPRLDRDLLKPGLTWIGITTLAALPIGVYFLLHSDHFLVRASPVRRRG